MKLYLFLPLTFLAGPQGFLMFAPYAMAFMALAHVLRRARA
jgi:hypothetical protein